METFLRTVAEDLYKQYGKELSDIAVVFPNNRARLFFNQALYEMAGKPIWTPQYLSLSDLFALSGGDTLTVADPLRVNGMLYQCYRQIFPESDESFDEFYGWGNIILSDFDNIDKNCADARQLFRNISEQGAYEDTFEHLSEAQKEVIKRFFGCVDISKSKSELKRRFINLWNGMYQLYNDLHEQLLQKGLAYEGMFNRIAVENGIDTERFTAKKYVFVGFNALNVCETKLFERIHAAGKAIFYWDYDFFYIDNTLHEAGRFLRENLVRFPNRLDASHFHGYRDVAKKIQFIASPTETAQAHFAGQWLKDSKYRPNETAIVLCNESLLLPMLHCIPDEITNLNVTMGYPMAQTPVYNLLRQVALLHCDGYRDGRYRSKFSLPVLQNPYLQGICPQAKDSADRLVARNLFSATKEDIISATEKDTAAATEKDTAAFSESKEALELIFTPLATPQQICRLLMNLIRLLAKADAPALSRDDAEIFLPLYQESLFQCYTAISHLSDLLDEGLFEVSGTTYRKLLLKVLSASIPFSGEPLRGIQLMGLLETRSLDFKHVLFLSVNEGVIPKKALDSSFIPYNLRRAFGLTGPEHQDAISAYYFFRFIERAEDITCVYNSSTEGIARGEVSRFLLQLQMESPFNISHASLTAPISGTSNKEIVIEKSDEVLSQIPHKLSPSAINAYIDCPLKFYFKQVRHLKVEDEISEDIDGALFGTLFHAAAQHIYTHLMLKKQGAPYDVSATESFISQRRQQPIRVNVQRGDIEEMLKSKKWIEEVVDSQFSREVFKRPSGETVPTEGYNGEQLIQRKLIILFLKRLLQIDMDYAPFDIVDLESPTGQASILTTGKGAEFTTGGIIDRIDLKGDTLRIVDYKTGGQPVIPKSLFDLFDSNNKRGGHILQTFLYASLLSEQRHGQVKIKPVLLYIHKACGEDFTTDIRIGDETVEDIRPIEADFREILSNSLTPLYDRTVPFTQAPTSQACAYCDFRRICAR